MRATLLLTLMGVLFLGCQHPKRSETNPAVTGGTAAPKKRADRSATKPVTNRESSPQATPIRDAAGKVASVNPNLRFVVIDFSLHAPPPADQRMNVYRQGQKVGEVKISSQMRNNIIAADITAGDAQVGDEVRAD